MCGIFGVALMENGEKINWSGIKSLSDKLFCLSETRGSDASGVAILSGKKIVVSKAPVKGSKFVHLFEYKKLFKEVEETRCGNVVIMGHTRLATNGPQSNNSNNQPIYDSDGVITHNGIIVNNDRIWKNDLRKRAVDRVDTKVILKLLNTYLGNGYELKDTAVSTFKKIEGSASIAYISAYEKSLLLATNTGSLYYVYDRFKKIIIYASEKHILKDVLRNEAVRSINLGITQLKARYGLIVNLDNFKIHRFLLNNLSFKKINHKRERLFLINDAKSNIKQVKFNFIAQRHENSLTKLKKHDFDYKSIRKLRRCALCILPSTMPGITFDKEGVCNYCNNHVNQPLKGESLLKDLLAPYKNDRGEPDCLLAFSGGRDSSYGLYYLKTILGMNPIAYTYDWGMLTDLGRRNQARMLSKLGVEHVIVAADINKKLENIRKNVYAWLKKPDLGMIPLLTVGDKQAEYYADRVAKRNNLKLIIYCSGCDLENDEFKAAYAGVKNGYPGAVLNRLVTAGRIRLASYYIRQLISNPSYINSSLLDSAFGFFSIYIKKHKYLYLWDYIPWNEEKIVSLLTKEFGWEKENETNLTWRTDDGTPAFYNYIYYQIQGFTENDTFRSNQIRVGELRRSVALDLAIKENRPRYEALRWYFDRLGVNGHEILTAVDNIPKFY